MTGTVYQPLARISHEPDAFEAFYRDHLRLVQRFVARRVGDPHRAADMVADVFVAAIDGSAGYDEARGTVAAWLLGIGRHVIAAEGRRHGREISTARRIHGQRLVDQDALVRIEERLDAERSIRRVYAALSELPDRDRHLLELVAIDGLSTADAARSLGLSPATARVRLHRSRARLNRRLSQLERRYSSLRPEVTP